MAQQSKTSLSNNYLSVKQQGAALILMVFILSLVVLTYTVKSLNSNDFRVKEATNTSQALAEAKAALISWSVNHPNTPGLMPYPDRNADAGGYDGLSDCPGGATLYSHLIGRLPWKGADYNDCNILLNGLGKEFLDGSNEPLWYAVSKNLVHIYSPTGDPVINPSKIDNPTYYNPLNHKGWLSVYDKNGQLVSDRVAAIIFAPGLPIGGQDRSGGKADATNYLDTFDLQSGGGTKSNRTYSSADEDFYMGEDSRNVRSDNTVYQQPYYFNDKLVYITIDELMAEVEKRAAGEAKSALKNYYAKNSFFPYAVALSSNLNTNQCVLAPGNLKGLLPTNMSRYGCSCSNTRSCSCNFGTLSAVSYIRTSSSYGTIGVAAPTGACTVGGSGNRTCTCTGLGSCKSTSGATRFTCDATGTCAVQNNQAGSFKFTSSAGFDSASGGCSNSGGNVSCNGTTAGAFIVSCTEVNPPSVLPTWFTSNFWQDYIYYAISSDCTTSVAACASATPLSVGARTDVRSLLIASGKPIIASPFASSKASAQSARPSSDVRDYLDSIENSNEDSVFDAVNSPRGASYNDQMFIVAP
jgi:hypothetical protein